MIEITETAGNDALRARLEEEADPAPVTACLGIGVIGAGFIVRDVMLPAYLRAGFPVVGIASRRRERAAQVAKEHGLGRVFASPEELLDDPAVQVVDIAYPPDLQAPLVQLACTRPQVRAILVQKPLSLRIAAARHAVAAARRAGKILAVNQNMRFDQGIRVAAYAIRAGLIGEPVYAAIEMHAVPHWQAYLRAYDRLTVANMSVHHLDALRFLLGEVREVSSYGITDPRTPFPHQDGLVTSQLSFASGALATTTEDVWVAPDSCLDRRGQDVRWRITGTAGALEGTCGWPRFPERAPSTARYIGEASGGHWVQPSWRTAWFPDAFASVMGEVQAAAGEGREVTNSGQDHLRTLALVEAAYRSMREKRAVPPAEEDGGGEEAE